jgi:pyruvate/2-oxoglutarate dehydrogenase complex dihydrolipoamide dehydrogenase (E3) component
MAEFDLAVIGAGSAGLSVTAAAAQLGVKVVLIERARMGGDCLNTGCVPSKALLAASHAATTIRGAGRLGLLVAEPAIDWNAVRAHVQGAIAAIAPADSEARYRALGATVLRGQARFVAPDALEVNGRRLTARRIVVAAGSRAAVPPIPGLDRVPFLTNETLFDLPHRPEHLLILGGGPIGLEMADAFAGLGSRVTVVEAATIASREDPELAAGLRAALKTRGVTLLEGTAVAALEAGSAAAMTDEAWAGEVGAGEARTGEARTGENRAREARAGEAVADEAGKGAATGVESGMREARAEAAESGKPSGAAPGVVLVLADGRRIAGSHLLVAVGRRPNLEGLELEAGGVLASPAGIVTDRGLRSVSNRRVFAAGDIADPAGIGPRAFTHVGSYHAGIIVRRVLFRLPARLDYAALPRVTYTDPELAQVGMTEAEARSAGVSVSVLRWPLADNDRAVAEGDITGLVKLVVARGRVVGAGILAPSAGEMIGTWTLAIAERTRLSRLAGMIVPYPTRAEAAKRAAGSLFAPKLFSARTRQVVRWLQRLGG